MKLGRTRGATLGLAAWLLVGCAETPPAPPLNLLLISIDTLRADHLGCYGYPRETSPNIDRFASESIVFRNAFTTVPKTGPSMASLFSGKYPTRHRVTENPVAVPDEEELLAEILPDSVRKAAIVGNPTLAASRGYDAGFDEFTLTNGDTSELTDHALAWLGASGDEPFFLWVHYLDPHGPYEPPPELRDRFVGDAWYDPKRRVPLRYRPQPGVNPNYILGALPRYQRIGNRNRVDWYVAQYDAEIVHVDTHVGRLLDHLRASGLLEKTVVALVADHGESLGEHDYYFEHGMLVNEGSTHVPLILHHPELPPGEIDGLVQTTDVLPTLLTWLGIPAPTDIQGQDLTPLLEGRPGATGRDWIYAATPWPREYRTFFETVRTPDGKLVRSIDGELHYYDLQRDPEEAENRLTELTPEERDVFLERMNRFDRRGVEPGAVPAVAPELREQIRALGYAE